MNLIYILNIINDIYEHELFPKVLVGSIVTLILLFVLILIIGIKDSKKANAPKKESEEDIKDITFDIVSEKDAIKEDVTFEMPVLTKNLEDFKKNLEEEIQKESKIDIIQNAKTSNKDEKATKILDVKEIEDTSILPVLSTKNIEVFDMPKEKKSKNTENKREN